MCDTGRHYIISFTVRNTMSFATPPVPEQRTQYEHTHPAIVTYSLPSGKTPSGVALNLGIVDTQDARSVALASQIGTRKEPYVRAIHTVGDSDIHSIRVQANRPMLRFEKFQSNPRTSSAPVSGSDDSTAVYRESDQYVSEIRGFGFH